MTTDTFQRKLTAILSADVAGYSRLMGEDEEATVRTLNKYKEIIFGLVKDHHGRLVDSPGDNVLAEFASVVDAVKCAVQIQKDLKKNNEALPPNRKMEFRIGINIGDVIQDGDRIYGDGVNVAARIESLADPSGICISRTAYDQVKKKLDVDFVYLGEYEVKNIEEPVRVYKVLMEPISYNLIREKGLKNPVLDKKKISTLTEKPSIAVLPFLNLSSDPEQRYFVDGLTEEIINSLTQIPGLTVIARTSSFSFRGTNKTIQEIAGVLRVENILEGSVRKAGNSLRITTQLIKGDDGTHLWSEVYNCELKDIFKIQEDIANSIADKLKLTLEAFQVLGGTENIEAYEKYLVAKGQMRDTFDNAQTVIDLSAKTRGVNASFDAAIKLDPGFALAWTLKPGIQWYNLASTPGYRFDTEKDPGLTAAQRAIELEPGLAEAHYSLGLSRFLRNEFIEAESAYSEARELSDNPLDCYLYGYPLFSFAVGKYERANEIIEAAFKMDPLNQTIYGLTILVPGLRGDKQRVEEIYESGKSIFGNQWALGSFYRAMAHLEVKEIVIDNQVVYSSSIHDVVRKYLGTPEKGLAELKRIYYKGENLISVYYIEISIWAAHFGNPEFAMEVLEKAISINGTLFELIWLQVMREVRQLPRFKEFIREIGLVDYWKQYGWPDNNLCHPVDDDFECE